MENASGGFMSDLTFHGGRFGAWMGNQQFTVRNVYFSECKTAICMHWNWAWTFIDVHVHNCEIGLELLGMFPDKQGVGSLILSDWDVSDSSVVIQLEKEGTGRLILDNMHIRGVQSIVKGPSGPLLLPKCTQDTVKFWLKAPASLLSAPSELQLRHTPDGPIYMGHISPPVRPQCLTNKKGHWFGREKPSYETWHNLVNVQKYGAKGDGVSDDTKAIQVVLDEAIGQVIFVPYGVYVLHDTLHIPTGTLMVGEAQPIFVGTGPKFQDAKNPCPVIRVGYAGERGELLIADMVFSTRGNAAGAIVMEWNVHERQQGSVAMFDAHIRIGGFRGSEQELTECPKYAKLTELPRAAFLSLHVTKQASGYFQNVWIWTADHELDKGAPEQLNVLTDRGVLIESKGPTWMYGTASEHALLYQYSLKNASNVLLAMIQTESPYFQGHAFEPASQSALTHPAYPDPDCSRIFAQGTNALSCAYERYSEDRALGLHLAGCSDVFVLGSGQYSFFNSYEQTALADHACQRRLCTIDHSDDNVWLLNTATVGTQMLISIDGYDYLTEQSHREGFCSTLTLYAIRGKGHSYVV